MAEKISAKGRSASGGKDQHYLLKIAILILATLVAELAIWWSMIRPDGVDWLSSQIIHQPYPYAISQLDNGQIAVTNVIKGFTIILPADFQVIESKQPSFYLGQTSQPTCLIKSELASLGQHQNLASLKNQDSNLVETQIDEVAVLKKEWQKDQELIFELYFSQNQSLIKYNLRIDSSQVKECQKYLEKIKQSLSFD